MNLPSVWIFTRNTFRCSRFSVLALQIWRFDVVIRNTRLPSTRISRFIALSRVLTEIDSSAILHLNIWWHWRHTNLLGKALKPVFCIKLSLGHTELHMKTSKLGGKSDFWAARTLFYVSTRFMLRYLLNIMLSLAHFYLKKLYGIWHVFHSQALGASSDFGRFNDSDLGDWKGWLEDFQCKKKLSLNLSLYTPLAIAFFSSAVCHPKIMPAIASFTN